MYKQIGAVFAFLAVASSAFGQQSSTFKEQFKLIKAPNAVSSLGAILFGDQTNLYSGALEFKQLDVSLPGNNKLDVMVGRRLTAGRYAFDDRAFGKWDLEIPRLHGIFARGSISLAPGWVGTDGSNNRCSSFGAPPEATGLQGSSLWAAEEFWRGNFMYIPGHGDQQLLARNTWGSPAYTRKPTGVYHDGVLITNFPVVTSNHWQIACLSTMQVGSGQGFLAVSPDGTKYVFDRLVNYSATTLTKTSEAPLAYSTADQTAPALTQEQVFTAETSGQPEYIATESDGTSVPQEEVPSEMQGVVNATLPTTEVWILPSRVIDRFGNTVTYTYDPARPKNVTKIASSDGRVIDIAYVQSAICLCR